MMSSPGTCTKARLSSNTALRQVLHSGCSATSRAVWADASSARDQPAARVLSAALGRCCGPHSHEVSGWRVARWTGSLRLLPSWAAHRARYCHQAPASLTPTCTHTLLSVVSTYLDDPAGVFSKMRQALQLAQGCDGAGQRLEHGGCSGEGKEAALAARKARSFCQHLQRVLQGGALREGRWVGSLTHPSSFNPPVPEVGRSRVGSAHRSRPGPAQGGWVPWLTERLVLWCVRGVGRWQA